MIQTNVLNCGTGAIGTWFDGCKVTPKDFVKIFLLAPSVNISLLTDTFTETTIAPLIKAGKMIVLNDVLQVMEAGAKTNIQTLPNKSELIVSNGLYKFSAEFEANVCLVKSMHKIATRKWQLILIDSEGKVFFDNKSEKLNGFEIQSFSVDNETTNDGGSKVATFMAYFQLTRNGSTGYNERRSFLTSEIVDYYGINGIQDVKIAKSEGTTLDIASFKLQVVAGCDGSSTVDGLETNIQVYNASGINQEITWTGNGNGLYTPTGLTAAPMIVKLYDDANNTGVVDIDNTQFYQSNVLSVTFTD